MVRFLILGFALSVSLSAFAQEKYADLIKGDFASPLDSPPEVIQEQVGSLAPRFQEAFAGLAATEAELAGIKSVINSYGYSATQFGLEIHNRVLALSPAEKTLILVRAEHGPQGVSIRIDETDPPKVQELARMIRVAKNEAGPLFSTLHPYIQDTIDVAMAWSFHSVRYYLSHVPKGSRRYKDLAKMYKELDRQRKLYLENKHEYEQNKDTYRTSAVSRFFGKSFEIFHEMSKVPEAFHHRWARRIKETALLSYKIITKIPGMLTLIPATVRLLKVVINEEQPKDGRIPFTEALNDLLRKYMKVNGIEVVKGGEDNIPRTTPEGSVDYFAPSHRHGFRDQLALAALNLDNVVFYAAVANFTSFLPKKVQSWLINKANKNKGIIVVGKGADPKPVEKSILILQGEFANRFVNYFQGRLPEGLGASSGMRRAVFEEDGPIEAAARTRDDVNITTITMPRNARLADREALMDDSKLAVNAHPRILHEDRKIIQALGGTDSIGVLLHYGLLDELTTNEDLLWGQVRGSKIPTFMRKFSSPHINGGPRMECVDIMDKLGIRPR